MPFTLSHAAAALPFKRLKPIWPALVMGTFAPDIQYFVMLSDEDRSGHRFPYVLIVTLPVAVLLLWVFENWVKGPLIELLPDGMQQRLRNKLEPLRFGGLRQFVAIVAWTAIGILTHIAWDQITHPLSWLGQQWGLLSVMVPVPFHNPVKFGKLLQFGSSLFGLLVILLWGAVWYQRTPVPARMHFRPMSYGVRISLVVGMTLVAGLVGYSLAEWRMVNLLYAPSPLLFAATLIEAVVLVFSLQMLLYGVTMTFAPSLRRTRPS